MTNTEARALLDIIIFSLKEVRDRRKEEKGQTEGYGMTEGGDGGRVVNIHIIFIYTVLIERPIHNSMCFNAHYKMGFEKKREIELEKIEKKG